MSSFPWSLLSYLLVVFAGVCIAFQQILNTSLREHLGSPWLAGSVSFFVGLLAMLFMTLVIPGPRLSESFSGSPPWAAWLGGVCGAIFVGIAILMVPRLGAATTLALVVVGQMVGSVIFDHFGLMGTPQHPISLLRMAGAAFLIVGVVLIRS